MPRRTQIADRVQGTLTTQDLLPDEEVWVTLSPDGTLTPWRRRRSERAEEQARLRISAPPALQIASANTREDLYLFSAKGQATRIGATRFPKERQRTSPTSPASRGVTGLPRWCPCPSPR